MATTVYTLHDPTTGEVRYAGKTAAARRTGLCHQERNKTAVSPTLTAGREDLMATLGRASVGGTNAALHKVRVAI